MGRGSPAAPYLAVLAHPPDEQRVLQGDVEAPAGDADIWGAWRGGAGDHGGSVTPPAPPEPDGATLLLTPAHADARPWWHPPRTPPHLHGLGAARGPPQLTRLRLAAPPNPLPPPQPLCLHRRGVQAVPQPRGRAHLRCSCISAAPRRRVALRGRGVLRAGAHGGEPLCALGGSCPSPDPCTQHQTGRRDPVLRTRRGARPHAVGQGVPGGVCSTSGALIDDFLDLGLLRCAFSGLFGGRGRCVGSGFGLDPHLRVHLFVGVALLCGKGGWGA